MSKLRLGVIGAGSWTVASHLPNFAKRRDDVEFVGVCRRGADLLARIKHDWGFQVSSEDCRDVIDAGMDICLVASPHGLHYEHTKAALEAGAHVLCEKPFVLEPAQAWELVAMAEERGLHLVLGYGWNYHPVVREARSLMVERGVGEIEQSTLHMATFTRELLANLGGYPAAAAGFAPDPATWTDPRNGGGYGQAQLTHALGLSLWLTDLRGGSAVAFTKSVLEAPVELHNAVAIRFDNGSIGTMSGGSAHLGKGHDRAQLDLRVIGSEGHFEIDLDRDLLWLWRVDGYEARPTLVPGTFEYDCDGPPNTLVDLALGKDVLNCSPGELGARTVEILDAAYRSAASGKLENVRQ